MKYTALSLFVIGVASVNAGTVVSTSSSSGSSVGNTVNFGSTSTPLLGSGNAQHIAAAQGTAAGAGAMNGW